MVFFKCFKKNTLTILENEGDSLDEGTTLLLYAPLTGPKALSLPEIGHSMHIESWTQEASCELTNFGRSKSVSREHASGVLMLNSSHHYRHDSSVAFELLGDRIHNGAANWSCNLPTNGEFIFLDFYWEWLEDVLSRNKKLLTDAGLYDVVFASLFSYDRHPPVIRAFCEYWCPETNTLHTSQGELSISLWDLHKISGLPIHGKFYDEVVPSVAEFTHKNSRGSFSIPASCRHLFSAYHKLSREVKGKSGVKITSWIRFWYRGSMKYKKPLKKSNRNKLTKPKGDPDPSGAIGAAQRRNSTEQQVFNELGITTQNIEESYLAAFLACWLCKFVFPKDDASLIRPGVFKVASRMATGELFSLAVPVLANIYNGLNEISNSRNPGDCAAVVPFHYVYGWLGEYFSTHFSSSSSAKSIPLMSKYSGVLSAKSFDDSHARALFRNCENLQMDRLARVSSDRRQLTDDSHLRTSDLIYFMSLRSGYVSLRQENRRIIQPYNPHRFGRQFGYVQHVPGKLKDDIRSGSLSSVYLYWESCTRTGTNSLITLPAKDNIKKYQVTRDYVIWWSKVHRFDSANVISETTSGTTPTSSQPKNGMPKENCHLAPIGPVPLDCVSSARLRVGSNVPIPRAQRLSSCSTQPIDVSEEDGDEADSHEDHIILSRRQDALRGSKRRIEDSHEDSEVNFRHRKKSLGPLHYDEGDSFLLGDAFLGDAPSSSQPIHANEVTLLFFFFFRPNLMVTYCGPTATPFPEA